MKDECTYNWYIKSKNGHPECQFTWETVDIYSGREYNGIVDLNSSAFLEEIMQVLSTTLHHAATNAFAHITSGTAPMQNGWYDASSQDQGMHKWLV